MVEEFEKKYGLKIISYSILNNTTENVFFILNKISDLLRRNDQSVVP
jgi:hypothetical protein